MRPPSIVPVTFFAAALLILTANTMVLLAQNSSTPTLHVDTRVINIPVVVHDKKGALVQNLTKDNFVLMVDNQLQTIGTFDLQSDLSLTLGLMVDVSTSQRDAIEDERKDSLALLDDTLTGSAGRDKAFVIQFAHQTDLLQDITGDKPKLQAALKQLETTASGDSNNVTPVSAGTDTGNPRDSSSRTQRGGSSTLYDALFLAADELMSKQTGRKAIILLSNGVDNGSKESLTSSIEAAQRADTIVYAIYIKGRETGYGFNRSDDRQGGQFPGGIGGGGYPGGGGGYPGGRNGGQGRQPENLPSPPDGKKVLQRIADETGGGLFELGKKNSLADIYKQIAAELRAQYRLGYAPGKDTCSDGYHRIDLSLSKSSPKDLNLQTRDGYYCGD